MSFSCFRGSNSSARVNCGLGREGKGPEHRAWEQGRLLSPTVEVGTQSKLQFAASRWPRAGTTTATPPPPPHSCTGDVYKACSLTAAVPPSRNKCDVFVLSMAGLAALLKTGQVSPVDGGERASCAFKAPESLSLPRWHSFHHLGCARLAGILTHSLFPPFKPTWDAQH